MTNSILRTIKLPRLARAAFDGVPLVRIETFHLRSTLARTHLLLLLIYQLHLSHQINQYLLVRGRTRSPALALHLQHLNQMAHRGSAIRPRVPEIMLWMWMSHAMAALVAIAIEGSLKGGTTEGTATATETEIAQATVTSIITVTEIANATGRGWTGNSKGIAWTVKGLGGLGGRVQEVLLSATVMRPPELGTACKSEVWLEDGKIVQAEVPRVDLLRDQEGEAVLEVTGDCWTELAHRLPIKI